VFSSLGEVPERGEHATIFNFEMGSIPSEQLEIPLYRLIACAWEEACKLPQATKLDSMVEPIKNPRPLENSSFLKKLIQTRGRLREVRSEHPGKWQQPYVGAAKLPKVSVMVITYNHERYIGQAIDSILMQERDFEIEINVIDDCSTDNTQRIVRDYQRRHPGIINCYFNVHNVGHIATQLNTFRGFQTLRGEYFALLEGDDYWTDSKKLKEQVGFLDDHVEYVACAHNTLKVFDDDRPSEHFLPFKTFNRERATMADLITMAGVFHLSSIVYRNVFGLNPPQCLASRYSCEVTINMLYGQFGNFYCIDKYMSAYRVHDSGVFSSRTTESHWIFHLSGYRHFMFFMGARYWALFSRAVVGFSQYALLAHRRGVGPRLNMKSKLIFGSHLVAAGLIFGIFKLIRGAYWLVAGLIFSIISTNSKCGRGQLKGRIDNTPTNVYRQLLSMLPDQVIHRYLAAESKVPLIRRFRLACKRLF
jgi:glycosyltransferase involved in cell wall biosynthesis